MVKGIFGGFLKPAAKKEENETEEDGNKIVSLKPQTEKIDKIEEQVIEKSEILSS